jgi:8-oxo-dGTP diphosphatase
VALRNWFPVEPSQGVALSGSDQGVASSEPGQGGTVFGDSWLATAPDESSRVGAPGDSLWGVSRGETGSEGRATQFRRGAKALVTASESALLVRERHADGSPFWTLPGGGVHAGESTVSAVERELAEELCCRAVVADPLVAFPYAHTSSPGRISVYTVHQCHLLSEPTPVAAEGVYDLLWVSPDSFPTRTLPQVRTVVERALDC